MHDDGADSAGFNGEKKMLNWGLRDFRSFEPDATYTWKLKLTTSTRNTYKARSLLLQPVSTPQSMLEDCYLSGFPSSF
jgi:hypothetical protein